MHGEVVSSRKTRGNEIIILISVSLLFYHEFNYAHIVSKNSKMQGCGAEHHFQTVECFVEIMGMNRKPFINEIFDHI